jgi:hypothetical protein
MATNSGTIDIRATPAEILAVLADVPAYPQWSAHGVSWSLVKPTPQQKDQRGSYSITDGAGVSHVHCELMIDPTIPLPGLVVRQIMKKALTAGTDGLKRRVESQH